jgi:hypothetical protein
VPQAHLRIGVIVKAVTPVSVWASPGWAPAGLLPDAPGLAEGTRLGPEGLVFGGLHDLVLYSGETAHYRDNLTAERPSVWVALRRSKEPGVAGVTVNPYEGESLAGDEGLVVAALPMPEAVRGFVSRFFAEHHVERAFEKRRRKPADPEALARRGPGRGGGGESR